MSWSTRKGENMNPKVDWYFEKAARWQTELGQLRVLVLDCELREELKWGVPCYTSQGRNIVLIHAFKDCLVGAGQPIQDVIIRENANIKGDDETKRGNATHSNIL
jgi:uncharacterized protein YdeI (YjbR/CyaY-like superfamily)